MRTGLTRLARLIAAYELPLAALCAPALVFPTVVRPLGALALAAVVVLWLARWCARAHVTRRTAFDVPIIVLLLAGLAGWWAAPDPQLSVTRLTNLVLAVTVFYAVLNAGWPARRLRAWLWLLVLLAGAVALFGLAASDWNTYKYPLLRPIYSHIPQLISGTPGAPAGLAPNELAGVLSAFLPAALALVWLENRQQASGIRHQASDTEQQATSDSATVARRLLPDARPWYAFVRRSAACALLALILFVLILTQGRVPLLAVGLVALVGGARLTRHPARTAAVALVAAAVLGAALLAWQPRLFSLADADITLERRVEVWQRGLWTVRDFPFTGAGLGMWPAVSRALYGYILWGMDPMGHPHDFLLTSAVEMGVPGLLATLGLFVAAWRTARRAHAEAAPAPAAVRDQARAVLFAAAGGLAVFALFGIIDSIALGARPSGLLWLLPATLSLTPYPLSRPREEEYSDRSASIGRGPGEGVQTPSKSGDTARGLLPAGAEPALSLPKGRRSALASAGRFGVASAAAVALVIVLWPVLQTNLGLVALSRALWHEPGYALSIADPARAGAAEPLLGADLPGAWRGRAFIAAVQGRPAVDAWQRAGATAEDMLAWGLWAMDIRATAKDPALWQRESIDWYERAASLATGSHRGMIEALIAQRQGRPEEAIAILEEALQNDAGWRDDHERLSAIVVLGTLHLQLQQYAEAEAAFARAVSEYAGVVPPLQLAGTYAMLGRAARAQGDYVTALDAYAQAVRAEPESAWRRIDLAIATYEAGNRDAALGVWEQVAAHGLDDDWALATWADFLARHEETGPLRTACAAAPPAWQGRPGPAFCDGLLAWSAGRYADAAAAFEFVAPQRPRDGAPYYWLGRARAALGDYTAARAAYEQALALAPEDADAARRLRELP